MLTINKADLFHRLVKLVGKKSMPEKTKQKAKPKEERAEQPEVFALIGDLVKEIQNDREVYSKRFDVIEKSIVMIAKGTGPSIPDKPAPVSPPEQPKEPVEPNAPVLTPEPQPAPAPEQPKVGGTPAPAEPPQAMEAPVPVDYITAKNEILGEEFGIKVESHTDNPVFTLTIIVPKQYSNYPYYDQVGADIRSKVISYAQGIHEVKKYFELIKINLGPENLLKGKIAGQKQG